MDRESLVCPLQFPNADITRQAPASFLYDFVAQQYGINAKPNMLDIHNRNLSFWSPQPYFIVSFFAPQQIFQLVWLYRLYKLDPAKPGERAQLDMITDYVPYYVLGNVCIGSTSLSFPLGS